MTDAREQHAEVGATAGGRREGEVVGVARRRSPSCRRRRGEAAIELARDEVQRRRARARALRERPLADRDPIRRAGVVDAPPGGSVTRRPSTVAAAANNPSSRRDRERARRSRSEKIGEVEVHATMSGRGAASRSSRSIARGRSRVPALRAGASRGCCRQSMFAPRRASSSATRRGGRRPSARHLEVDVVRFRRRRRRGRRASGARRW